MEPINKSIFDIYKNFIIENELYYLSKKEIVEKINENSELKDDDFFTGLIIERLMDENKELFIVAGNEDEEL